MAQQKSDENGQPSTINQTSSLGGSKLLNNRTEQDSQSSNSGLSTNIEKAQHISGKESIILCSEHPGHVIKPTCDRNERDNIVTSSNNNPDFVDLLNELKVNKHLGNKERCVEIIRELEKMKGDQKPQQVEDQNQNPSDENAQGQQTKEIKP